MTRLTVQLDLVTPEEKEKGWGIRKKDLATLFHLMKPVYTGVLFSH